MGSYHASQLLKAVRSGRLQEDRILVVDRDSSCLAARKLAGATGVGFEFSDWLVFLRRWLKSAARADYLVPAPVAPHLLWEWLAAELGALPLEPPRDWRLPYQQPGSRGEVFLSAAGWACPATCVEPEHCPVLHGPRDWDLSNLIAERAAALGYEPCVFRCVHLAAGVGAIAVRDILEAKSRAARAQRVLVATTSHCHAAVGALQLQLTT